MDKKIVFTIIKRTIIVSLIVMGIMAFVFSNPKPIILGYLFGAIISILGFKLLYNTIQKSVTMSPQKATAYSTVHYMLRYFIYSVVLGVAALADYLSFPAAILGLLILKFVILASGIFDKQFKVNN